MGPFIRFPRRSGVGFDRYGTLLALVCVLVLTGGCNVAHAGDDETTYRGRRLVEILNDLRASGVEVVFSTAVVGRRLRVGAEPAASDPRAVLDEILPPLGLRAEDGPGGSVLILPAQGRSGALAGRVFHATLATPVAGAAVHVPGTGAGTLSGPDGAFEIRKLPAGRYRVVVEAVGFATATITRVRIDPDEPAELRVELRAQPDFVTEVVVTPNRHSVVRQEQAARHTLTSDEAVLAPTIGGDVTRLIELLPGVTAADNTAAFNVRGSVASDVALVLDGLELYDPFHLQSFQSPFSLIDSNVVDRVDFFGGGFTADLGDRHGGFVEISTSVPSPPSRGEIELGTLNSRVSYHAPMARRSGSWLVSARAWYPEAVRPTTELGGGENLDPRFADAYAKVAFNVASRHRFSVHGLTSYDRLTFRETKELINETVNAVTRNSYGWFRSLSVWSDRFATETILSGGRIERIRDGISSENGAIDVDDDRSVNFFGLKHDATWQSSDAHALKFGADARWLDAEYRYSNIVGADPSASMTFNLDPVGTSVAVYAAWRARLRPGLATEIGARWDRQDYTSDNQLSPRFNAVWRGEHTEWRLALGRFHQSQRIHELRVEDGESEFGRAEVAEGAEISFRYGYPSGLRLRVDAYARELSSLRPRYENLFEPIELFPETIADRKRIVADGARLRGVELLLRGDDRRPLVWWVGYTLSEAEDEDQDEGRRVPRSWDQPHAVKALVGYRRGDLWSVSVSGSAHTGWPNTPVLPEETVEDDGSITVEGKPGLRNSDRYGGYARIDFKGRRSFDLPRGRLWLTLEVINLTNRKNACCLDEAYFTRRPDGGYDVVRKFDTWLGITPSFNVLWEF